MDRAFGKLDHKATREAFAAYLLEWKGKKIEALQKKPTVGSVTYDGTKSDGTPHDPDARMAAYVDALRPCHERKDCCHSLASVGEEEEILADLLIHRYIKRWRPARTLKYLNSKYKLFWDDRTYRRKKDKALWEGALICKDPSVRVPK